MNLVRRAFIGRAAGVGLTAALPASLALNAWAQSPATAAPAAKGKAEAEAAGVRIGTPVTYLPRALALANGRIAAQGSPEDIKRSTDPLVQQFVHAQSDGPVHFHYPAPSVAADFLGQAA